MLIPLHLGSYDAGLVRAPGNIEFSGSCWAGGGVWVNQPRLEGTHATGPAGFLCPWVLLVTVTPSGVGTDVKSSSLLLLRFWVY